MNEAGKEVYDLNKIPPKSISELYSLIKEKGYGPEILFIKDNKLYLAGILKVSNLGLNRLLTEDARVRI